MSTGGRCRASGAGGGSWPCSSSCGRSSSSPPRRHGTSTAGSRTTCRSRTAASPPPVQHALTPAPVGAARQTTLVAGIDSHKNVAGTVILARVDSTRHAVEILTVPSTVAALERAAAARRAALRRRLARDQPARARPARPGEPRAPDPARPGRLDRALAGRDHDHEPEPGCRTTSSGASGVFPAGRVALTGRTVQWYLDPTEHPLTPGIAAAGDFRQAVVVRGVTDKLVHLTTPSAITAVGSTISRNFNTDLSPDPVLGIVAARLRAHTLVDCRLGTGADLARPRGDRRPSPASRRRRGAARAPRRRCRRSSPPRRSPPRSSPRSSPTADRRRSTGWSWPRSRSGASRRARGS